MQLAEKEGQYKSVLGNHGSRSLILSICCVLSIEHLYI